MSDPPPPYNPNDYQLPPGKCGMEPPQTGYAPQLGGYAPGPPPPGQPSAPSTAGAYPPPPVGHGYPNPPPPAYGQPAMCPIYTNQLPHGPYVVHPQVHPAYPPGSHAGQPVIVTQPTRVCTTTTTVTSGLRQAPCQIVCPHCQAQVVTNISHESGTFTVLLCAIICLVGCDLGCCLIPFCVEGCKDVVHRCPNCRQQISRWNRM